jgi:riboflavin kinase/FMN adenylyltransferase
MKYFKDTFDFSTTEPTCLTIGKFDGLHMGHKKLLDYVAAKKEKDGLKSAIFTFDTPPKSLVDGAPVKLLTTNEEKHLVFEQVGIDYFVECPFNEEIMNMRAEHFIEMMVRQMNTKCFVVGTDCHFGHERRGNGRMLRELSGKYGYEVIIVEKKTYEGRDISSTFVREEIEKGNIEKANLLLGYPYFIKSEVVYGNQLGRTIGIPTMNQIPQPDKLLPPNGVYASRVIIDGTSYKGVTNIGVKPTVSGENVLGVETHVIDFTGDLYGRELDVELFSYIRPEKKFSSVDSLKRQIESDIRKVTESDIEKICLQ